MRGSHFIIGFRKTWLLVRRICNSIKPEFKFQTLDKNHTSSFTSINSSGHMNQNMKCLAGDKPRAEIGLRQQNRNEINIHIF